LLRTGCKQQ